MKIINIKNGFYNLITDKNKGAASCLIKGILFLLSLIYCQIVRLLIFIRSYNRYYADCIVISVGNITLGGTGKTPVVEYLAKYLKGEGRKVAILSRGYKKKCRSASVHRCSSYETMGDEAYMLQENLKGVPVVVNADRRQGISIAINDYGADTIIMDDGFQQWGIKKDLDIVTIDALIPFGNRHIFPRGILRQPLSSLKQADVFILTRTDVTPDISDIRKVLGEFNPLAIIIESVHKPVGFYPLGRKQDLSEVGIFKGKTIALVSGIANPDSFKGMVADLGVKIGASFDFPDHYSYSSKDLDRIILECKEKNIACIITTEKDAARLSQLPVKDCHLPVFVLRIEISITRNEDEERLHNRLRRLYPA